MSNAQGLLDKIAALRQQLQQARGPAPNAAAAADQVPQPADDTSRLQRLERQVTAGSQQTILLDSALRQLAPSAETTVLPKQLTARARRLLLLGRALLDQLRELGAHLTAGAEIDPLAARYQETAAMADTALRMVQAFPDAASAQLRLCEGLEAILHVVSERIGGLQTAVGLRQHDQRQINTLTEFLAALHDGQAVDIQLVASLATELIAEAQEAAPLRFLHAQATAPAAFIACHSLTVAQIMARLVRQDPDLRHQPLEPVLAALLEDAGMLAVPVAILSHAGPLHDEQRRVVESHARLGAALLSRLLPTAAWLAEAAAGHHERLDGTGYPAGLRDEQLTPLTRLLSICDVYAALCAPRPHRSALDTRTALTDTLLLAEQGRLDRFLAERLLQLSFYPVGSIVELADGAVAMVVATHMGRRDLNTPARPVLALLTDSQGQALPVPRHVDLAQCEHRSIVRTLPRTERRQLLGRRYPELAGGD
jgi:HD-GYP domain-containing protein (c-di-GMP phosphodiesterase class II)